MNINKILMSFVLFAVPLIAICKDDHMLKLENHIASVQLNYSGKITLLHKAVINDDLEFISEFIKAMDANTADDMCNTPLMMFRQIKCKNMLCIKENQNSAKICQILIEHGADVNRKNIKGMTALMNAAYYSFTNVAEILLKYKARLNETDLFGRTALFYCMDFGAVDIVRLLLKNGIDITIADIEGKTAFDKLHENLEHSLWEQNWRNDESKISCVEKDNLIERYQEIQSMLQDYREQK